MNSDQFEPTLFQWEQQSQFVVVWFLQTSLTDEMNTDQLGNELTGLVDHLGFRKIEISLKNVTYITSSVLGKIIHLHRHLKRNQGKLVICEMTDRVMEIMETSNLDTYFTIFPTQADALRYWNETSK